MRNPKIRFKGYADAWEQRKVADVFKVTRGYVLAATETSPDISNDNIYPVYSSQTKNEGLMGYYSDYLYEDAITWTTDGANAGTVKFRKGKFYCTNVCGVLLSNEGIANKAVAESLNAVAWKYVSHVGNPKLMNNVMSEIEIMIPKSVEEQLKISEYLDTFDNLITLHRRKCEEIKTLKKFMLQKMFPQNGENVPEIRFDGFTDAWEQRKWIDVVDISTEMVNPTTGEYDNMPHIAPGNIESFTGRILDNVKTVKEEQLISGKFRFRPDDVVYGKINPQLGKYFYATVNGLTSADAYVFNGKNGLKQKFLFALLQTSDFFKYSVSVSKRSGMPKINRDEINAYSFLMPSEEEQDKVGSYLLQLDNLITLHQRKCDELQSIKKFMLQNMFV